MTQVASPAAGTPIPAPADFPVSWPEPGDESLPWRLETQHLPGQHPRMEFDITWQGTTHALAASFHRFRMPIESVRLRLINTYVYRANIFARVSREEMAERGQQMQDDLRDLALSLDRRWTGEWLPMTERHLDHLRSTDLTGMTPAELRAHLDDAVRRLGEIWDVAFYMSMAIYFAMSEFDDLYRDLFGSDGAFEPFRLLGGLPNHTLEVGQELWQLSRRATPAVRETLLAGSADVRAELARSAEGRAFLADLATYLERYGRRTDRGEVSTPGWVEDPTPVLTNLRNYLRQPDDAGPLVAARRAAATREEAVAAARARLSGYPAAAREGFEQWLAAAQTATRLSEDHANYMDLAGPFEVRRVLLEAGTRLVEAGALADAADVFLLSLDELRQELDRPGSADCRRVAADRRAELARFREVTPPKRLGVESPPLPGGGGGAGFMRKFAGVPGEGSGEPGTVTGVAGSPGRLRGTARLITSLPDSDRLAPGDILVTESTAPPWTPLFAVAGAVVTDSGGVLSHCAVVAREYGIPAVVGTGVATAVIKDGQEIEVDGDAGLIRVVSDGGQ